MDPNIAAYGAQTGSLRGIAHLSSEEKEHSCMESPWRVVFISLYDGIHEVKGKEGRVKLLF